MKKKIIISAIICVAVAAFVTSYSVLSNSNSLIMANLEALSTDEAPNECCKNGYKKWYGTSNVPTQRKEYFKDCECDSQEGYDPQSCSC